MAVRTWAPAIAAVLLAFGASPPASTAPAQNTVGATGTIEPRGGVVLIAGVPGANITAIKVSIGQPVKKGQVLMLLDDQPARLDANLAMTALQEARRHARQATSDEATALSLATDRATRAERQAQAYRALGPNATSQLQINNFEATAAEARSALAVERRKASQIRADGADEVTSASRRYKLALTKLDAYRVSAPTDGVILQIDQHVGEILGGAPAVKMGDVSAMYVICDAYQGDLLKIAPGMAATVTSSAFRQTLTGRVEWVGRFVQTKSQTGQFRIRLDDTALASRLIGMQVNVKVQR